MKTSALIEVLAGLVAQHGDLPVRAGGPETGTSAVTGVWVRPGPGEEPTVVLATPS